MHIITNKKRKAFGLLEVLLASVIIIIILGALVVISRAALNNSVYLQQRAQATDIAQEGIEMVRYVRDTNNIDRLPVTKWNSLIGALDASISAPIDGKHYGIENATTTTSPTNRARITPGTDTTSIDSTIFTRDITFTDPGAILTNPSGSSVKYNKSTNTWDDLNAYRVTVTVTWASDGNNKSVKIQEILANSREAY